VTGAQSRAYPLRLSDRLQQLLPNAEHVEIPNASHAMTEQNAPAVSQAILNFLGRCPPHR
jgi:pimeloyl-ACP methyl ester carboxylesterase